MSTNIHYCPWLCALFVFLHHLLLNPGSDLCSVVSFFQTSAKLFARIDGRLHDLGLFFDGGSDLLGDLGTRAEEHVDRPDRAGLTVSACKTGCRTLAGNFGDRFNKIVSHKALDLFCDWQTIATANTDRDRKFAPERIGLSMPELVQAFEQSVGGGIHAGEIVRSGDHKGIGLDELLAKGGNVIFQNANIIFNASQTPGTTEYLFAAERHQLILTPAGLQNCFCKFMTTRLFITACTAADSKYFHDLNFLLK